MKGRNELAKFRWSKMKRIQKILVGFFSLLLAISFLPFIGTGYTFSSAMILVGMLIWMDIDLLRINSRCKKELNAIRRKHGFKER